MRILFITGEFPPMQGGVGDCTNEIALALAKRGVEVSVMTTNDERRTPDDTDSISVQRTVKRWDWGALGEIRKAIRETRADIYHIQYQTAAFGMHPMINFAPRLMGLMGVKSVVTFHDLRPMYLFPKAGRARDWVTFHLARASDAVVATNEQDYARLERLGLKCFELIPIGSNIDPTPPVGFRRETLRAKLGVRQDEILLCYFGFLNDSKGGETLIRALAEMPNAKLVMLGGQTGASDATNKAYLGHVKQTIANLGLNGRVLWTDFLSQEQVSAHFLAADACVLPYRDGASYRRGTFMAALAHGMAIVTTDRRQQSTDDRRQTTDDRRQTTDDRPQSTDDRRQTTEHRRQTTDHRRQTTEMNAKTNPGRLPHLVDGENVMLVPPEDAGAIAAAVKRIAASAELRARLQRGARETAQFFTWDKIAAAHFELYENLLRNES